MQTRLSFHWKELSPLPHAYSLEQNSVSQYFHGTFEVEQEEEPWLQTMM